MNKGVKILILSLIFGAFVAIGFFASPLLPFVEQRNHFDESKAKVITLYGYLHVYPIDLGNYSSEPRQLIKSLNEQKKFGRNDWRVPTQEEVETFLACSYELEGINSKNTYMSSSSRKGMLRLVATDDLFSVSNTSDSTDKTTAVDAADVAKESAALIAEQISTTAKSDNKKEDISKEEKSDTKKSEKSDIPTAKPAAKEDVKEHYKKEVKTTKPAPKTAAPKAKVEDKKIEEKKISSKPTTKPKVESKPTTIETKKETVPAPKPKPAATPEPTPKPAPKEEEAKTDPNAIYVSSDKAPMFLGGNLKQFSMWMISKIKYPQEALSRGISGMVIVSFVVEKDGKLSNIEILRSPHKLLSDEVIRVFGMSPKWVPGSVKGEPVRVKQILPVPFKIQATQKSE